MNNKRPKKMMIGNEICEGFGMLSDEGAGKVIKLACAMHLGDEDVRDSELEGEARFLWRMLKRGLNANAREYMEVCIRNQQNRRKGLEGDPDQLVEQQALGLKGGSSPRRKKVLFDRTTWTFFVPQDDIEGWKQTYPGIDVDEQILRAAQWLKDHPRQVKKDYRKFLGGWMGRQNSSKRAVGVSAGQAVDSAPRTNADIC